MDGLDIRRRAASKASPGASAFCYEAAFSRNLGWTTEWEQQALRAKRVAIGGMGGVGGFHLLTLVRFGIGSFHIADLDKFELVNFNRQIGADLTTIGRPKVEVMAETARQINPELRITCFSDGITEENIDDFLKGVDLYIDGLDFFVLSMRRRVMARCAELGIPVINAAPLGMGTAFLVFEPGGMTFEQWFRLEGLSEEHQYISFLLGLAPSALHRAYLVDPSRVDFRGHRGPSTVASCELCAAVASVEAVKIMLGRGRVRAVPYYHQFDPYRGRWIVKKLRGGNSHPLQRLKIVLTRRFLTGLSRDAGEPVEVERKPQTEIEQILDLARWAPSGDNIQPWRFVIVDDEHVVVHLTDQGLDDVYEYRDGEPTLLSGGALLESLRIAASARGRGCQWDYQGREARTHRVMVFFPKTRDIPVDPLVSFLPMRSVDRRPYRLRKLSGMQKGALAAALAPDLEIDWHEELRARWHMASLGAKATAIRLSILEAYEIHQRVIDWDHSYSPSGIPAGAAGFGRASLGLMRWAMQSWSRMRFLNHFGGRFVAAVQMDYIPGIFSAAFFTLRQTAPATVEPHRAISLLRAGAAIQRFWLTATRLGLNIQPNLAPICFASYGISGTQFTADQRILEETARFAASADRKAGGADWPPIFQGRIGMPLPWRATTRSIRLNLGALVIRSSAPS